MIRRACPIPPAQPAIIEIVGPAGVGKSAVAARLAARERVATTSIWRAPLPLLAWGTARALPWYLRLARRAHAPLWREFKHMARLHALDQVLEQESLEQFRLLVLDEGPVFTLTWLQVMGHPVFGDARSEEFRRYWLGIFSAELDAVVRLDAADDVLADRLRTRDKRHVMQGKSNGHVAQFSSDFRAGFDQVIDGLQRSGRIPILRFDTDRDSAESIAERILQALPR